MIDLKKYRGNPQEQERIQGLLEILPRGRQTILDIGARDGYIAKLLTDIFESVTALDLERPKFTVPNVITVKGDVTSLDFSDNSFDTVLCAEVLEHIPPKLLGKACQEIARVAKYDIVIGVPYNQDIRVGRALCVSCGKINPPWGHVNVLNDKKLIKLFRGLEVVKTNFIGKDEYKTNFVSSLLMDMAGNPWGTYIQDEPCIRCGKKLVAPPKKRNLLKKGCSKLSTLLTSAQKVFAAQKPIWVHMVLKKK